MDLAAAIKATNALHTYVPESGGKDRWRPNPVGDCEDYSFAVVWRMVGETRWGFIKAILSRRFRFWFVKVGPDYNAKGARIENGHFVTEDRHSGLMFDNTWGRLTEQSVMERRTDYRFVKSYWKLWILWKVAIGRGKA